MSELPELSIRPLESGDLEYFDNYGCSVRGITATKNGEPIIIAGVLISEPLQAFSLVIERGYPRMVVKMMRKFKDVIAMFDAPIYAIADENEEHSENLLRRVGFKKKHDRIYAIGAN